MDIQSFLNASLKTREASISVPALSEWFDGDPVWVVRGVTAAELGRARAAADEGRGLADLVAALANNNADKSDALRKLVGVPSGDVPRDVSLRIQLLIDGSVNPAIGDANRDVVVKLAESYPTIFYELTTAILNLTGQGAEVGKRKASGSSEKSAT